MHRALMWVDAAQDAAGDTAPGTIETAVEVQSALAEAWGKVVAWGRGLIESLPNLVAALVVLVVFWLLARVARRVVGRVTSRFGTQPEISRLVAGAAQVAVVGLGLVLALGVLNLDKTVTSLLAGAGILGLALGFAFQDIAENFIAGIILNVQHQFHEGDVVQTNDFMGIVERVDLRATVLRTFPGQRVLIPNADVFKNALINYSQTGKRRVDVDVGVAYDADLSKVPEVATAAVARLGFRDSDREVEFYFQGFGDSAIDFQVRFWIDFHQQVEYLDARSHAIMAIKAAFDRAGITIPFPIRTLDFDGGSVGGQSLADALGSAGKD
ncbi:MAG TPA: mechanosensitive ion channel family protein [Longimicrobiales bacterium]|nr:mechanosensitive ion channel family protein [Longimicrobiales bacterium]